MAKAAIIGCGMIAGLHEDFSAPRTYSHAKAFARHPAFTALAVTDPDLSRAQALAAKSGALAFKDVMALLDGFSPDVAAVCAPDDHHMAVMRQLLGHPQRPRLIFCEKPVCTCRDELGELIELERQSGTRVIVNHSRRYDSAHLALKALIASGQLGAFVQGHADYYGGWRHLGVHVIDILQYLLDQDFEPEQAVVRCTSKYADDPTLDVRGRFGRSRFHFDGFPEPCYQILDLALMFERGQIKILEFGTRIEVWRKTVNAEAENVLELDTALSGAGMAEPMVAAVALIARYLETGDDTLISRVGLAEARRTMNTLWKGDDLHAAQSR